MASTISLSAKQGTMNLACLSPIVGSDSDSGLGTDNSAGQSPFPENTLAPWSPSIIHDEPVAVVGMACRFSKVESPSQLWDLVKSGRTGRTKIPERSWNAEAWYHPSRQRTGQVSHCVILPQQPPGDDFCPLKHLTIRNDRSLEISADLYDFRSFS